MNFAKSVQRVLFWVGISIACGCDVNQRNSPMDKPTEITSTTSAPTSDDPAQSDDTDSNARPPSSDSITIEIGMDMAAARSQLLRRGKATQMAFSGDHDAYIIHDELVVVITGKESLESILLISNFGKGKAFRDHDEVERFTY